MLRTGMLLMLCLNSVPLPQKLPISRAGSSRTDHLSIPTCEEAKLFNKSGIETVSIPDGSEGSFLRAKRDSEEVLLKLLPGEKIMDRDLQQQIEILQELNNHGSAPYFFGACKDDRSAYIVMEFLQGRDLLEILNNRYKPFPLKEAKRIIEEILTILKALHDMKIVHRDLKLENVMYDLNSNVRLIDFGDAMKIEETVFKTPIVGTESYNAPEMFSSEGYNELVDIYAAGLLFLELISGRRIRSYVEARNLMHMLDPMTQAFVERMICIGQAERLSAQQLLDHSFLNESALKWRDTVDTLLRLAA